MVRCMLRQSWAASVSLLVLWVSLLGLSLWPALDTLSAGLPGLPERMVASGYMYGNGWAGDWHAAASHPAASTA